MSRTQEYLQFNKLCVFLFNTDRMGRYFSAIEGTNALTNDKTYRRRKRNATHNPENTIDAILREQKIYNPGNALERQLVTEYIKLITLAEKWAPEQCNKIRKQWKEANTTSARNKVQHKYWMLVLNCINNRLAVEFTQNDTGGENYEHLLNVYIPNRTNNPHEHNLVKEKCHSISMLFTKLGIATKNANTNNGTYTLKDENDFEVTRNASILNDCVLLFVFAKFASVSFRAKAERTSGSANIYAIERNPELFSGIIFKILSSCLEKGGSFNSKKIGTIMCQIAAHAESTEARLDTKAERDLQASQGEPIYTSILPSEMRAAYDNAAEILHSQTKIAAGNGTMLTGTQPRPKAEHRLDRPETFLSALARKVLAERSKYMTQKKQTQTLTKSRRGENLVHILQTTLKGFVENLVEAGNFFIAESPEGEISQTPHDQVLAKRNAIAKSIVTYLTEKGPFQNRSDLKNFLQKPETIAEIREFIEIDKVLLQAEKQTTAPAALHAKSDEKTQQPKKNSQQPKTLLWPSPALVKASKQQHPQTATPAESFVPASPTVRRRKHHHHKRHHTHKPRHGLSHHARTGKGDRTLESILERNGIRRRHERAYHTL